MADDSQQTFTAREIVLEFFPATRAELIPQERECKLERGRDGSLLIADAKHDRSAVFAPVARAGNPSLHVCCDICQSTIRRGDADMLRAEVPGSSGRRYRYICACRNTAACDARRLGDTTLRGLLERVLNPK